MSKRGRISAACGDGAAWLRRQLAKPLRFLEREPTKNWQAAERLFVRVGIPLLFGASIYLAIRVTSDTDDVPSVAFGNHFIFAAQLVLLIFYAILLLVVPLVRGVIRGELPVELTLKGPRYAELVDAGENIGDRLQKVEDRVDASETERQKADKAAAAGIGATVERMDAIADVVARQAQQHNELGELTAQAIKSLNERFESLGGPRPASEPKTSTAPDP